MTNEDAKNLLLCHRNDIGNKNRIEKLSRKIYQNIVPTEQQVATDSPTKQ